MQESRQFPFLLLYAASFLAVSAFAIMLPLLPLYGAEYGASFETIGALAAVSPLVQLFVSPLLGMLSDKFGRKPLLSLGLFGMALSFALFAAAPNLPLLFAARALQGLFAGAVLPNTRAYVADLAKNSELVAAMGKLNAFLALGIILGPAAGGILGEVALQLPFYLAAVLTLLNAVFVLLWLPESLREKALYPFRWSKALKRNFTSIWWGLKSSLAPLFLLAFLWSFAFSANAVALPLLAAEAFRLSSGAVGMLFVALGAVTSIIQFSFLTRITGLFGLHATVLLGLLLMGFGFSAMPLLPAAFLLYGAVGIAAVGSAVARPVITALVSQETEERQGVSMGTVNSFESLGRLAGPLFGAFLFGWGTAVPFLGILAAVLLITGYVAAFTRFLKGAHAT